MNNYQINEFSSALTRQQYIELIHAAFNAQIFWFAHHAISRWIDAYPGDLEMQFKLAKCLVIENRPDRAEFILSKLVALDIENVEAYKLIEEICGKSQSGINAATLVYVLGKEESKRHRAYPDWAEIARVLFSKLTTGELSSEMHTKLFEMLSLNGEHPITAMIHLLFVKKTEDDLALLNLARIYHQRWPECVQISCVLADTEIKTGDTVKGLEILKHVVSRDNQGLVIKNLFGEDHPYHGLWTENIELALDIPIPSDIMLKIIKTKNNTFSENKLPEISKKGNGLHFEDPSYKKEILGFGTQSTVMDLNNFHSSEDQEEHTDASQNNKSKNPAISPYALTITDQKLPYFVILSSKKKLVEVYGEQASEKIISAMGALADNIAENQGLGSVVFLPDDTECVSQIGIDPIGEIDPWKIKLALHDLEKVIVKNGGTIGSLLIIGGDNVVPFHRLPNPTDDSDQVVLSDNPYSTNDPNYFVPEWPVGRLPGEYGTNPEPLFTRLQNLIKKYELPSKSESSSWWEYLFNFLSRYISRLNWDYSGVMEDTFGYSAEVWRRSSIAVFRPIGSPSKIQISPPGQTGKISSNQITKSQMGYYNLHGLPDTDEWYGQADVYNKDGVFEYPVAIKTADISKNGMAPQVIFSEACYGAYILGKTGRDSIAVKFLEIGVDGFVGSTCIAYGSINTPLIGADLLANYFWRNIRDALSIGDAFMKAKHDFITEMNKRQGYLDGEDQKTLLSFVLYGDPMVLPQNSSSSTNKQGQVKVAQYQVPYTFYRLLNDQSTSVSTEKLIEIKKMVSHYLPGMNQGNLKISKFAQQGLKQMVPGEYNERITADHHNQIVVTLHQEIKSRQNTHQHFARATIDASGKVIKLAISR